MDICLLSAREQERERESASSFSEENNSGWEPILTANYNPAYKHTHTRSPQIGREDNGGGGGGWGGESDRNTEER